MSSRHVRKICGGNELPPLEDDIDEEFEPLYADKRRSAFACDGFNLGSDSESEQDQEEPQEKSSLDEAAACPQDDVNQKKKRKKKPKKRTPSKYGSSNALNQMDEIDKCVSEVNAILGTTELPPPPKEEEKVCTARDLLLVQKKHLNSANELKRLFGASPEARRRGRSPETMRLLKKSVFVAMEDIPLNFQRLGISMSIQRRDSEHAYFVFDHSRQYQRIHKESLLTVEQRIQHAVLTVEDAQKNLHIEGLIENADSLFLLEDYQPAITLIEQAIACFQYVAHPAFNLTNPKTRLEYKFAENRTYHVVLLKYLYLISNKACHRTALEIAKVLLNLDPNDPLAVVFVIDTLAIRAREYQWLIDATHVWSQSRYVNYMFNFKYSNAMAHFYLAYKKTQDLTQADGLLREAMMVFPTVFAKIMECANSTISEDLKIHPLFTTISEESTTKKVKELMYLYAMLSWSWWREPPVLAWLTRNAKELATEYDNNPDLRAQVSAEIKKRRALFQSWPVELLRHLHVIRPMSGLLVEGAVPPLPYIQHPTNPMPPADGIDSYGYSLPPPPQSNGGNSRSIFYSLFNSIIPDDANPMIGRDDSMLRPNYEAQNEFVGCDRASSERIIRNTTRNPSIIDTTLREFNLAIINTLIPLVRPALEAFINRDSNENQQDPNEQGNDLANGNQQGDASQGENPQSGN